MPTHRKKFKVEFNVDVPTDLVDDKVEMGRLVFEALETHPMFCRREVDLGTVHARELYAHKERTRG